MCERAPLRHRLRPAPGARRGAPAISGKAALLAAAIAILPAFAPAAEAGVLNLTLSSHYSTGGYGGTHDVEIVYVPLEVRYDMGLWSAKALVPWLRISGGSAIVETPSGPVETKGGTNDGLGDILLEVQRSLVPIVPLAPWVTLRARVKLPTADEDKGLGTNNFDLTPEIELAQRYGRWTPFLTVGYRLLGNSGNVSYRDGFTVSVGTFLRVLDWSEVGVFLDWKDQATGDTQDSLELLPMLRFAVGKRWTLDAYASAGFSDAVPDVGTGLELEYVVFDTD